MEASYSARAGVALKAAKDLAILHNNPQVTDLHVTIALLEQKQSTLDQVFQHFHIDKDKLLEELYQALSHLDAKPGLKSLYYSRDYQSLILRAQEISRKLYNHAISTNHLLLALLQMEKTTSYYYLTQQGLNFQKTYPWIEQRNEEYQLNEKYPQGITEVLKQYGSDLTQEARDGKLDPVIGREEEMNRLIQILSRRIKNNPIIVGEPGVGKTAVVEGLAQRIVSHDVPESLQNRTVFSLRMADVIAGSKLRGEFEERMQEILDIIADSHGRIILFIDEIHTVIGTGSSSGGMDTSNIIKPLLARGQIHVIGATTLAEYSRYIQKDGALERRFQKIVVNEPTVEDTISILRGIKTKYESFHGLRIKDEAIVAAANLSDRYISNRHLPDKAIDILDEACSMVRTEIDAMPLELDDMQRRLVQLQTEKVLIEEESSASDSSRLAKLKDDIENLTGKFSQAKQLWQQEKGAIDQLREVQTQIEQVRAKQEEAKRADHFEEVVQYSHVQLPRLEQKARELLNQTYHFNIIEEVNQDHIAEIVAKTTGIPVSDLNQDEIDRLLSLEERLNQQVIGQQEAVRTVTNSIIRAKAGMKPKTRPIASYLFVGPTGVGKTYLAKVLTQALYQSPKSLIRLDMSEYMDKNSITKLIGSPPGYVGYEEGGQLTEKVANQPYSVVLFDEIEKADPQVFNILLQILDEGRLSDNKGRLVDFTNTVIILTSNIGSRERQTASSRPMEEILLEYFNPEFLNRLDGIIEFEALSEATIQQIIDLYVAEIEDLVANRHLNIDLDDQARQAIISASNYHEYGSREVVRTIRQEIETLISYQILKGQIKDKQNLWISVDGHGNYVIKD